MSRFPAPSRLLALAILVATTATVHAQDDDENHRPPDGFVALFNGNDLTGWHGMPHFDPRELAALPEAERASKLAEWTEDARRHWTVRDGALVNDGMGPYLTTDREFGDIELLVDYQTVAQADSGIYLRGTPQVQIWDFTPEGGKGDLGAEKGSGGLWNNSPGAPGKDPIVLADRPFGEWNHLRIIQVGARTTVYLNDRLVVDHAIMENYWDRSLPLFREGVIQLQTHGGEIQWRDLFLREIPPEEANRILAEHGGEGFETIFDGRSLAGWAGATDSYEVVAGAIRCKPGEGGVLYHDQEYADFAARMLITIPPGGNNGLAVRYPGMGDTAYVGMCELQVLDDGAEQYRGQLDPRQFHGSAYGMAAATPGYLRAPGTPNFQEITVQGSRVKVELNGTVILAVDLASVTEFLANHPHPGKDRASGFFGFAGHDDPVEFREVAVKRLD